MKKMYARTTVREIRQSFGRFAAIIAIVALGVGFLTGLLSTTPDMEASVDSWYQKTSMSDFDIKSTMGLTQEDAEAAAALPSVDKVTPARVTDVLVSSPDGDLLSARMYGMDLNDTDSVNQLTLLEGSMPEKAGECVIENPNSSMTDLSIGDTITLSEDTENLEDTYRQRTFTITGIVNSPYYFCNSEEPSSVGTGTCSVIFYTDSSAYALDTYTDLFLTVTNNGNAFSYEYESRIEDVTTELETLSEERIPIRYEQIREEAYEEVDKAQRELNWEKKQARQELEDARAQLEEGQKELDTGTAQLAKAKTQLADGKKELKSGKKQLKEGKAQLKKARRQLNASKKELDAARDSVEQVKEAQEAGYPLSEEALAQIEQYDKGLAAWEQGSKELSKQEKALKKSQNQIRASEKQLDAVEKEIAQNEEKLKEAEAELASGRVEYEEGKAEAEAQIQKAERKIKKARQEIEDLEEPEWYILDRNSNLSYARYSVDVEKVADIATVFPLFFFLVAALVSLTTMTRMVEEERIQIGTLKALGYRKATIMSKYLIYCGGAAVAGCLIGLAAGFILFPTVIYQAYMSQYDLPDLILQFHWEYALLACGLEILCTIGATWLACASALKEKPALLMVPRAPKAGKRIFLERVGIIWKRLSFSHKATARNIFRYKKHLFMTVIGIAGCTALMVAGFGMRDSMSRMVGAQYTELLKYDMQIELSEDKTDSVLSEFLDGKTFANVYDMTGEASAGGNSVSTTICIPQDTETFSDFINLRERKSGDAIAFSKDSVIMTEKMAEDLELSVGDSFTLMNADDQSREFTLTGITENYIGCYLYIAPQLYADAFGEFDYNGYLLRSGIQGKAAQDQASEQLHESSYVSSVSFTSQEEASYESMLSSINLIVYVLILCAGALAVVVLYNLTNININERSRELATLRVLGYHHREVAIYIFREIGILSILGTLAGLIAGWVLHRYVILTAESVDFMMGREISWQSYLLAAVLTLVFSALVDILMLFKLRRIQMVESMKAVD